MTDNIFYAYYYNFRATGNPHIDAILEAIADAGKAYHHTESWGDKENGELSEVDKIQKAADGAAKYYATRESE